MYFSLSAWNVCVLFCERIAFEVFILPNLDISIVVRVKTC